MTYGQGRQQRPFYVRPAINIFKSAAQLAAALEKFEMDSQKIKTGLIF